MTGPHRQSMTFDDLPTLSAGQKRCMQEILVAARAIPQPFRSRPLVIAQENDDGSVTTHVTDEADARFSARPDIVQAIDAALRGASILEMPVIALAIDAAGMCAATCIEFGSNTRGVVTAERLWAAVAEGVAKDPTGPMSHAARRLAAIEQGEGGEARREEILRSIEVLLRYLANDPEVADAIRRGDTARVAAALAGLSLPSVKN